jgi:hypothetical protein
MKWSELAEEERDRLVHEKVIGASIGKCAGTAYYTGRIGEDEWYCEECKKYYYDIEDGGKHDAPIPHYSTDMNAAWQIVREMNKPEFGSYDRYARFIDELEKIVGSELFFDLFYCHPEGDHLNPDRICIAALKACGVEIEP